MTTVRVGMAQINTTVGNVQANAAKVLKSAAWAANNNVQILLTPELALTGYPADDLFLRPAFVEHQQAILNQLKADLVQYKGLHVVVGHAHQDNGKLYNAASVLLDGKTVACYCKQALPNYGVFDEKRYFSAGTGAVVFDVGGLRFGANICEDAWFSHSPAQALKKGAQVLLVLNASPFSTEKQAERIARIGPNTAGMATLYLNKTGGQDELVFDGASFVLDAQGGVVQRLPVFQESTAVVTLDANACVVLPTDQTVTVWPGKLEQVWQALVTAVRDYLRKTGFTKVLLGLSGGIDSAVVMAVAVDAIGVENVHAVMMPSRYTADISMTDGHEMASMLGVACDDIAIGGLVRAFDDALAPHFAGLPVDATEENVQARIRGNLLMALSNKTGALVLTTGNKSELATGYCTLYGDMAGGFAVIKDVPKTMVYNLARWRNGVSRVIPQRIIDRPPSAELRDDQTDQDSLPPYDVLDAIIERYVQHNESAQAIIDAGFDAAVVGQVVRLIRINEYKRRQGAIGPRITSRAFGRDWRLPIANGYRD